MRLNLSKYICILLWTMPAIVCAHAHAQWTAPTPEELAMTSQPQVPGAAAVYLFREETTEDKLHMWSVYARIKVLNEAGKKYADIELPFVTTHEGAGYTVNDIQGRTIHSDGTIVPFTGNPYEKLIEKSSEEKVAAKVFSLPDVQIGSILEFRYKIRYDDNYFRAPRCRRSISRRRLWQSRRCGSRGRRYCPPGAPCRRGSQQRPGSLR